MKIRTPSIPAFAALGVLLLAGCGSFSLAADVTPPPDYVTPTPISTMDLTGLAPSRPLDLLKGEGIYNEKCAPCHGETGQGDGSQVNNLQVTVPDLTSETVTRPIRPLDWYLVVANGRMERSMPGFKSLDSQQIWDTLGYIFSLGKTSKTLTEGRLVFEKECASCHGPLGLDDGPAAAGLTEKLSDWSDPASLMELSQQDLMAVIAGGKGTAMPGFADKLDENQIRAAAVYIRQLGFSTDSVAEPTREPAAMEVEETSTPAETESMITPGAEDPPTAEGIELPAALATASIRSVITNTSGDSLPSGLIASLVGYDAMEPVVTLEKAIDPEGSVQWDNLEVLESRVYLVSVEYGGITFRSQVIHGVDMKPGETIPAPIEIYETTSDKAGIVAERMHVFFDFPTEDRVQVVEMFLISNPGKAVIIPESEGGTVIEFTLPPGYENLQFESGELGERFLQTASGFGDTAAISPGSASHQILFGYELPYEKSAVIPLSMPLDVASAILMVPGDGVSLEAEGLQDGGARTVQEGSMHLYSTGNLAAGSTLELIISGRPGQTPVISTGTPTGLFIGGGVLVLVLVGIAVWLIKRREPEEELEVEASEEESVDSILDAIVALDDLYQAGKIPGTAYHERRVELKERLRNARSG
ncbi:MAG: c-type cytochrome [Anaerolineaceae bacterium]